MAKVVLGARPKNFKKVVKFPMLDGTTGQIEMSYKYRTRTEFGKFIDDLMEKAGTTPAPDGKFSMADLMAKTADSNAEYILSVADGWDVVADFTLANVQQLADEIPGAANAIMEDYREAITAGRLGN